MAGNPLCSVAEIHRLGWDERGETWKWQSRFFLWEEGLLRNCCFLLHNTVLQNDTHDHWIWLLDPIKGFLEETMRRLNKG